MSQKYANSATTSNERQKKTRIVANSGSLMSALPIRSRTGIPNGAGARRPEYPSVTEKGPGPAPPRRERPLVTIRVRYDTPGLPDSLEDWLASAEALPIGQAVI
jgi:hypothetical protein